MVKGFNSPVQAVCTCWCIAALLLAAISTVLIHTAFKVLLDPLETFPADLESGINDVLGFGTLDVKVASVKTHAETALGMCNALPAACPNPNAAPGSTSDTTTELAAIVEVFDTALATIDKVAHDRYLGVGDFAALAHDLEIMRSNLTELQNQPQPIQCAATNELYCSMHSAADDILNGMAVVREGVDEIVNNDAINQYEEIAGKISTGINLLPYLFWISALFYLCFLMSSRPSCKGGRLACCSCTFHGLFFTLSFLISLVFVAVGIAIVILAAEIKLPDPFQGEPTIDQVITHIETEFPEFYNVVLRDLIDGMKKTFNAYVFFFAAHVMLLINACTCCCGLYIDKDKASS
mmetsp:Transcript_9998/g.20689  ORF Transcript_9998/g.20689 Transcript_9998/m.20689 type:complete len:351 (+) Transcript_9998:56-1108(+)